LFQHLKQPFWLLPGFRPFFQRYLCGICLALIIFTSALVGGWKSALLISTLCSHCIITFNPNSMFAAQKKLFANLFANKRFVKSM
jgi:hypothetical protein